MSRFGAAMAAAALMAGAAQAQVIVASDNFNRPDSSSLGSTPVGNYPWFQNEVGEQISLVDSQAFLNSRGSGGNPSALLDLSLLDVDISMTLTNAYPTVSDNYDVGIMYRSPSTSTGFARYDLGSGGAGYSVSASFHNGTVKLLWGNATLTTYGPAGTFSATDPYVLRVTAVNDLHTIYLNGNKIIEYTDADQSHVVAGAVGMGAYYGTYLVSDFSVAAVPEPGSLALVGLSALGVLHFVRKKRQSAGR